MYDIQQGAGGKLQEADCSRLTAMHNTKTYTFLPTAPGMRPASCRLLPAICHLLPATCLLLTATCFLPPAICLLPPVFAAPPDAGWRESPAHVRLFTPSHVPQGAYAAYVSDLDLDGVLLQIRGTTAGSPRGAWQVEAVSPADAFGRSGRYDSWAVARLYGAKRARVARGPRLESGRVTEAWTLISPYPDPTLRRLLPGTLLIVLRLDRVRPR